MKNLKILTFCYFLLIINTCFAQKNIVNEQPILILKEFYTAYSNIWSIPSSKNSTNQFNKKIDSLTEKYCTTQLKKEVNRYLEDGHDLMTNDWGISKESINSLKIVKDKNNDIYLVEYVVNSYPISPNTPVKKQVILRIKLVKKNNNYKIYSVE